MSKKFLISRSSRDRHRIAWILRGIIFLLSFLLTSLVLVIEKKAPLNSQEFVLGEPAPRTLFSPFELSYVNEEATEALKREAVRKVLPVYTVQFQTLSMVPEKVDQIVGIVHDYRVRKAEDSTLTEASLSLPIEIPAEVRTFLIEGADLEEMRKQIAMLFETGLPPLIFDDALKNELTQKGIQEVTVLGKEIPEKIHPTKEVPSLQEVKARAADILKELAAKNRMQRDTALTIFNHFLAPNLQPDESLTKARQVKASEQVEPIRLKIKKNELIVQQGMLVEGAQKTKIDHIQQLLVKQRVLDKFFSIAILIFLIYLLVFFYLAVFERRLLLSFRMILLIHSILLLSVILCKIVSVWSGASAYLMPAAMTSVLIALLINPRIAILSCGVMAAVVSPMSGFSADVILATLFSSAAGVLASLRVRKRIHFLKVGIAIGVINFLVIFAFQILKENSFQEYFMVSLQGLANGLLITTPIVFLLVPLFEALFGLVTDITLLELSDLNHPLLKRMVVEAPGTYHHSLVVATLAESACEAIGANALLARVGCYFHDIGKIARAEYFTENEHKDLGSRHEKLTPTMSCLIVMNHVKDGIDLGKRYKLREPILRFIPEHQGTGIIYYFYKKALDQADPGERISAEDYRYPGPKPQSRETAVALLSDSTEAASRSVKNPTPESIRQLVRKIINDKFIDGQLDECNLSLRDLHLIQEKFVQNLMAIYHTRVSYPEKPEVTDKPDLFRFDDFAKYRIDP